MNSVSALLDSGVIWRVPKRRRTLNSWESSAPNNRADLKGMASYFRHIGGKAGIYSTAMQWDPIVTR